MRLPIRLRGLSILELLMTIVIASIATAAAARAFTEGLKFEEMSGKSRDALNDRIRIEDAVSHLVAGSTLHGPNAVFISPVPASATGLNPNGQNTPLGAGTSSLVFTSLAVSAPAGALAQSGQQFESLNQKFGGLGGPAEVALSTTPVGDAGLRTGLFLREQRPPDSDPGQGGDESLLSPLVSDIRFEFFDGAQWLNTWDSNNAQKGLLPSAVRVTYLLRDDEVPHGFFVRLPLSTGATK